MWGALRAAAARLFRQPGVPLQAAGGLALASSAASEEGSGKFGDPARRCTDALLVANAAGYAVQLLTLHSFTHWGMRCTQRVAAGEYQRLLTATFLHAGPWHLAMNSFMLSHFGPMLEHTAGHGRFLATYFASGVAASAASQVFGRHQASIGASGAIYGVAVAVAVDEFRNRGKREFDISDLWFIFGAAAGILHPRIDNWGHLGGAVGGAVAAYLLGPRLTFRSAPGKPGGLEVVDAPPVPLLRSR